MDAATRFRLRSSDQIKDATTRIRLRSADQLKDTATRFRQRSADVLKDLRTRLRLRSADQLRDIPGRIRLRSADILRDAVTRFRLRSADVFKDLTTRLRLRSTDQLRDTSTRFRLAKFLDLAARFRLAKFRDLSTRFILNQANQNLKDLSTRLRLRSANTLRDVAARFRVAQQIVRDAPTRIRLMQQVQKDFTTRLRLLQQRARDVATRVRLRSADQNRDVASRLRLRSANQLRDFLLRLRLRSSDFTRDVAARFKQSQQSVRNFSTRFIIQLTSGASKPLAHATEVAQAHFSAVSVVLPRLSMTATQKYYLLSYPVVQHYKSTLVRGILLRGTHRVQTGDGAMPTPNTTIYSTTTVTDINNALVSNLSSCSVLIRFPDGTTTTLSIGSGVTNLGSGQYQAKYDTKGVGLTIETWSVIAADGITKAQFQFEIGVGYN